ncbi:hypothetical protein TNCV_2830441 [Trichonephila clavipes]|nr:hypothetical protein TNCV_2830441 [Trichonephila clavipes]
MNWPPRSCHVTPLDYSLWGYVKSLVYADKPQTLDHLEDNICRVIADIRPQMLEKHLIPSAKFRRFINSKASRRSCISMPTKRRAIGRSTPQARKRRALRAS